MPKSALPKIFVSGLAIALLLILSFRGIGVSAGAVALAIVAVLPWLAPVIDTMNLPGGISLRFRQVEEKVEQQEQLLNVQQGIITQLVVYSMSSYLFDILSHLYHRREFLFHNDEPMQRSLRHLRDHGYLEHFNMGELAEGINLAERLSLTPVGNFLVEVRERLHAEQSMQAAKRLSQLHPSIVPRQWV